MSLIFAWSPREALDPGAFERFSSILEAQQAWYASLFGRPFHLELRRLEATYVGQIHFDVGVTGWLPGARTDELGLLWGGICEDYLGVSLDPAAIRQVVERADRDPRSIAEWDGRFVLCTWNATTQRVVVTPGATESPTLWHTEGPEGWAIGSRAAPLLEMTGREPRVDPDAASGYAAFGFLIGDTALLANVHRLRPRQQVIIERGRPPVFCTYVSVSDYLAPDGGAVAWADRFALGAERMTTRIRRQLRHSPEPVLLLTGGYDSRCIAAAAVRAGYEGAAYTSGPRESEDVRVASRVARRLGLSHVTSQGSVVRSLGALTRSPRRLEEWIRWTEGVDVIRQALPYGAFFEGQRPFPRSSRQLLHGFDGAMVRGSLAQHRPGAREARTPAQLEAVFRQRIPPFLVLLRSIDGTLTRLVAEACGEVTLDDLTPGQWITLLGWYNTFHNWGADMFSVRDLIDWHWTPYMDRALIRTAWSQSDEDRLGNRFLVDLAVALAPALAGVEYGSKTQPPPPAGILARMRQARRVAAHRRIWRTLLLRNPPRIWDQVIAPDALHRLIETEPLSEPLWCLATAELTAKVFGARDGGEKS